MSKKENTPRKNSEGVTNTPLILKDPVWTEEKIKQKSA